MIALLVTRHLNPERNVIQYRVRAVIQIMPMPRSWATLNLDSENPELRHLDVFHDEEVVRAVSNNLK